MLSFFPVVRIGTPPTPHPQAIVSPPPLVPGGGAHSLTREGAGESQFRRGDIHCSTLYINLLCGIMTAVRLIIFIAENDRLPERSPESQDPGEICLPVKII